MTQAPQTLEKGVDNKKDNLENALDKASDSWEEQMVWDVEKGKLDKLIEEIDADFENGELEEL